jgi:hypothetical protein
MVHRQNRPHEDASRYRATPTASLTAPPGGRNIDRLPQAWLGDIVVLDILI